MMCMLAACTIISDHGWAWSTRVVGYEGEVGRNHAVGLVDTRVLYPELQWGHPASNESGGT